MRGMAIVRGHRMPEITEYISDTGEVSGRSSGGVSYTDGFAIVGADVVTIVATLRADLR